MQERGTQGWHNKTCTSNVEEMQIENKETSNIILKFKKNMGNAVQIFRENKTKGEKEKKI